MEGRIIHKAVIKGRMDLSSIRPPGSQICNLFRIIQKSYQNVPSNFCRKISQTSLTKILP